MNCLIPNAQSKPVFALTLLFAVVAGSCGGERQPANTANRIDIRGAIVALVGRGGDNSHGELTLYDGATPGGHVLVRGVPRNLQSMTPAGTSFAYARYSSDVAGNSQIDTVDIETGTTRNFAAGDYPVSSGDRIAFCPSVGQLYVSPLDNASLRQFVDSVSTGCGFKAWSGSRLAFVQFGSSLGLDGVTLRLWDGGIQEEVDVAVPVRGLGDLSWSARGTSLLYANGDGELVEIDLASHRGTPVGVGQDPKYSPLDDDLFAVMTDDSIEVRNRAGGTVARHDLPQNAQPRLAEVNFAWSPDGTAIAVVTPSCINVWDWKSDEMSCAISPNNGAFLPVVLWFR